MKAMLKIELNRAFTGSSMMLSVLIGLILALSHFVLRVMPTDILGAYNPYLVSAEPRNLLSGWLAGTITVENEIYKSLVFILAVMPYGTSFYQDKKSGLIKNFYVRQKKRTFLIAKSISVFISAGVAAVVPLIANLLLTATVYPVVFPEWHTGPQCNGFFVQLYYQNFVLYYILIFAMIFIYAGLVAGLALSISLFANNIFIVLTSPFLLCLLIGKLAAYSGSEILYGFQLSRVFDVVQAGAKYPIGLMIITVIMIITGYLTFIVRGMKYDTF